MHDRTEVRHVARNVDGGDLPGPASVLIKAPHDSVNNECRVFGAIAQADEVAFGFDLLGEDGNVEESLLFLLVKKGPAG